MLGNSEINNTRKNPSSTVNITGLFFARYWGLSFFTESTKIAVFIVLASLA